MKHNYLITGGAGFIGSHFIHYLSKYMTKGSKVLVLDKLTYAANFERIESLIGADIEFVQGDICDSDKVKMLLEKHSITCIVNFAAESHVDRSIEGHDAFLRTNVEGVQNLMKSSRDYWEAHKFEKTIFLQISTDEVYGGVPLDTTKLRNEETALKPTNPYAATKAGADLLIGAYQNTYKYPAIIVRPTNNYGFNQHAEKLIPKVIDALMNNKPIPIYGAGKQKRTWLHVEDTCQAIFKIIEEGIRGDIYNIVGEDTLDNKSLVDILIAIYNTCSLKGYHGKITYVEDRLGHDPYYAMDGSKLKQTLGVEPKVTLEKGLEDLVKKHLFSGDSK